jgi:hypothetical protein
LNLWQASLEAQQVISLRLALLAGGGTSAGAEATRMVSEKISTLLEVHHAAVIVAMSGNTEQIPARTLAIYRRKIRRLRAPPARF